MWALLCTRERTAMAEGTAGDAPPRHVEVKMVASAEDRALKAVLTELLDRLQVTTHFSTVPDLETEEMWTPHPGAPAAVARAWIDLRERGIVTLYLTGDQQDRVLVRQVPLVRHLDEVAREEIAHIVEAAVDELLRGGQIGVVKKHAPELPPAVNLPPPQPEPPLRLDVGFGYAAQGWHYDRAPAHGPAAFVSLAKTKGLWRPGASFSAELRFPETFAAKEVREGSSVSMKFDSHGAVRLVFVLDRSLTNRWMARGGIGGGFDWIDVTPSSPDPNPVQLNSGTRVIPMLRALALARYAFAAKSELFFGLAADVDVQGTNYIAEKIDPNGAVWSRSIFRPSWFRPMALIGITADVLAY
jgi:hypothetical protein